jgi:anti-sigma factor (TIGR02949 family)
LHIDEELGDTVNCPEALDCVSAVVDGELEAGKKKEFDDHIAGCPSCRSEFEIETMTKRIVGGTLHIAKVPEHLCDGILQHVYAGIPSPALEGLHVRAFFQNLLAKPFVKPTLALGVLLVVILYGITVLTRREPESLPSAGHRADMVDQAVEHYSNYMQGGVKLQLVSSSHDEVKNFFKDKVNFEVYVPEMENSSLVGGVLCEHEGVKFLNLVYRRGDKVVYFYMGCSKQMRANGRVGLSAKVETDLRETGWYLDTTRVNCNVAVWKIEDNVCSVVADMGKEELLALVKEE